MQEGRREKQKSLEKGRTGIPTLKEFVRELPVGLPEEVMGLVRKLPSINGRFSEQLEVVTLYRPALGSNMEACWLELLDFVKKMIGQINVLTRGIRTEYESKIENTVKNTTELERNNINLKDRLERIEMLREMDSQDLSLAEIETAALRREINSIYEVMQRDMKKVLDYLVNVEKSQDSETSSQMFVGLERLADSIKMLEQERNNTSTALSTMNELIKAMAKNTKMDSCTQVEQSQLQWLAKDIFPTSETNRRLSVQEVDRSAINIEGTLQKNPQKQHIITQLQIKQREVPPEVYNPKRNVDKPWVLPPTILVFLQNMSKENENGRVLPWQYVKKVITEIYQQRITYNRELISGMVGNVCSFDEFFALYFIRKNSVRRLAELKMLEFVISLKYYSKFWPKAEMFAYMLDIMRFQPGFEVNETINYRFDLYAQNFFLAVFARLNDGEVVEWDDGATYANFQRIKNVVRKMLFFADDLTKSRLFAKLQKSVKLRDKKEYADYDFAVQLFMDEYFAGRKRNFSALSKVFSRFSENVQGYFSLKEITSIFKEFEGVYSQGTGFQLKYPADSPIQLAKLYLYSITSAKNNFEINGKEFLAACQRFGFDCPFPFLHVCSSPDITFREDMAGSSAQKSPSKTSTMPTPSKQLTAIEPRIETPPLTTPPLSNIAAKRVQIGSILFSQHFSILRQLREYCLVFKETMQHEKDTEKLWGNFQRILQILEKGCHFLKLPLKT